jgi:hypothetical protein
MNPNNPFCAIDPLSPLCVAPAGVVDAFELEKLQIEYLQNALNSPGITKAGYRALFQLTLDKMLAEVALRGNCVPPRIPRKEPCLQPGSVFDISGALELNTLNYTLVNDYGITQGIFRKPCLLYFYTPSIVYSVTFGVNGAQYQIKRFYKNEGVWVMVARSAYLMEVTYTLQQFAPFLGLEQIVMLWTGVVIPLS